MAKTLGQQLKLRQSQLEEIREPYENGWGDVTRLVNPRRELIRDSQRFDEKGDARGRRAYTGEPQAALGIWADGMQGHLVSQSLRWFKGIVDDSFLGRVDEVQQYLQRYDEAMYGEYNRSNFYSILGEWFRDAGSIGTATLFTEEDIGRGVAVHIPIHPREIFVAEDRYGNVDTVFRKFFLTAKQAVEKFGTERLHPSIIKDSEGKPEARHEFIHATFPNTDRMFGSLLAIHKPIASVYMQKTKKEDIEDGEIVRRSGFDTNPYAVWRFRKNSDEPYGYSPATDVMVSIKKANQFSKTLMKAAQMASGEGPYNVPEHMRGNVRINPGGFNYFPKGGDVMGAVNTNMNYPIAIDREEKVKNIIEDAYRVEFFLILARAEREMTATEIVERANEKSVLLGPQTDRLITEGLRKVFDIVSDIADKGGRLPEPPQILVDAVEEAKAEGRVPVSINIRFIGPLAVAQRRQIELQPLKVGLNELGQASVLFPKVLDRVDPDRLSDRILDVSNFPQGVMRTDAELNDFREQQAAELAQQQAQQQLAGMADAYPKITGAPEEGSPAAGIGEAIGV